MLERFVFYLNHSLNDLRVNLFRTLFVVLCISTGVAAVVGLQNMGVMIDASLTGNLREQNRGDIALNVKQEFVDAELADQQPDGDSGISRRFSNVIRQGVDDGALETGPLRPGLPESAFIVPGATDVLAAWLNDNYDGDFEIVVISQAAGDQVGVIIGGAPGSVITSRDGNSATQQSAIFIDPDEYPLYGEVRTQDDRLLAEALSDPRAIVLSEKTAARLDAEVGDTVGLLQMEGEFKVTGIVPDYAEVRDPFQDFLLGVFGYYYIDIEALETFANVDSIRLTGLYIGLEGASPQQAKTVADQLTSELPYLEARTTEDILAQNEDISDAISQVLAAIGLLALLLGSIGIINTMQVIVRRRTLEIGVLKTIGLKGRQITMLFLVEALLLGVVGSLLGTLLGTVGIVVVRDIGQSLTSQRLDFLFTLDPVLNGIIVGIVVTAVFGFLPTLAAARVRPNIVLRPEDAVMPRSGCLPIVIALFFTVIILSITVMNVLDVSFLISAGIVAAAFAICAVLFPLLWVTIWAVARFTPKLGRAELQLAKTQLSTTRSRAAVTLLALVIGIFSLSSIALFADALSSLLDELLVGGANGQPVLVQVPNQTEREQVRDIIAGNDSVESYTLHQVYNVEVAGWSPVDSPGTTYDRQDLQNLLEATDLPPDEAALRDTASYLHSFFTNLDTQELGEVDYVQGITAGRHLSEEDIDTPGIVIRETTNVSNLNINLGDEITLALGNNSGRTEVTFTVVGLLDEVSAGDLDFGESNAIALIEAIPSDIEPRETYFMVGMPSNRVGSLQADMQALPDVFVFDLRIISTLIDAFVEKFAFFPTLFGVVGLIVGAVVIANSVALTTLERRRDIAVLKALGLKRMGVLTMILTENALLGLVGALLGVGFGVIGLFAFDEITGIDIQINWTTAALMSGLSILIAVSAALAAAWGATGERPLNVLRYE